MRPEKKYVRAAGGIVSAGVLAWVAATGGSPVQADPGEHGEHGGDHDGDHGGEHDDHDGEHDEHDDPAMDPREGSPLFLSDTEGTPGSKFTIGGRDCNDQEMDTFTEVTVEHEDGTQIKMPEGVTDDQGNWEMTAEIPEDMAEGTLSIEAACWLAAPEGIVGFAPLQPQAPVFNYASGSFNVTLPSTTTTTPDGGGGDDGGDGEDGGGDGAAGPGDGQAATGTTSTSSSATSAGAAPGVTGEADYTG